MTKAKPKQRTKRSLASETEGELSQKDLDAVSGGVVQMSNTMHGGGGGEGISLLDVKVPSPGGPVPIPYPNKS